MAKTIKRLLITGGTGFIGRNLIERLSKKYELVCIIKDRSYKRDDIKIIHGDVTDNTFIKSAMIGIDAVVHLAAILDSSDKNIEKINVGATQSLVDAAKRSGVKKFVFISSENVIYDFDDEYSSTKRLAEKIVKRDFKNYLILRPTVVYGRYDKRYVNSLVEIAKRYKVLPIPGDGKKLFQPVYVGDVIKCIENGLKYDVKGEYVVAGPSKISYDDFTRMLVKELGIEIMLFHIPLRMLKVAKLLSKVLKNRMSRFQIQSLGVDKVYDITPSVKFLKYKPTPLKVGIKKTLKFFKLL